MTQDKIALFDMDGTLFDYEKSLRESLARIGGPNEGIDYEDPSLEIFKLDNIPHIKNRIDLIRNVPGWWRNLLKLQLGWDLHEIAERLGFKIHILTKGPSSRPHAWQEKVECLHKHFDREEITIHITEQKSIHYGRVLVDDYPEYVISWLEHRCRGLAILPINASNKGFHHPNVIMYDGSPESLSLCRTALQAAFKRKKKQHWKDCMP